MFSKLINDCFQDLKYSDASKCKSTFGYIWAVFASKKIKLKDGEIVMSWREISAELAKIYNEWFNTSFTTDAFLRVINHDTPIGENSKYDEVFMRIYSYPGCAGIYQVLSGKPIMADDELWLFSEVNVVTGEKHCYKQEYVKGNCVGSPKRISNNEFEKLSFSMG